MQGFETMPALSEVIGAYPEAKKIVSAASSGGRNSKMAIARLWLSEGIPFAFKDCPAIYESIRVWLSSRLLVHPKDISITGSARLGQSLAPQKLGKEFSHESDLDLFIISSDLFSRMVCDFNQFSFDYEAGHIKSANGREEHFWKSNVSETPGTINRGFIDSKAVPSKLKYSTIQNMANSLWLLKEKLDATPNAPKVKKASIRCYKGWPEYVNQILISLS